jgi:hypothetical protein
MALSQTRLCGLSDCCDADRVAGTREPDDLEPILFFRCHKALAFTAELLKSRCAASYSTFLLSMSTG